MAAAASVAAETLPQIPAKTLATFIQQFEQIDAAAAKEWKATMATWSDEPGAKTRWIQAANKTVPCTVYATSDPEDDGKFWWDDPASRIYWDGDCREGRAFGLGREFLKTDGVWSSYLGDYAAGNGKPTYHANTDFDQKSVWFLASAPGRFVSRFYQLDADAKGKPVTVTTLIVNAKDKRIYREDFKLGGDKLARRVEMANGHAYVASIDVSAERALVKHEPFDSDGEPTGYSVVIEDDGIARKVQHFHSPESDEQTEVKLPPSYLEHLTNIDTSLRANLAAAEQMLEKSYAALDTYKQRVCKGDVRVDFMDSALYGRICLANGDMAVFDVKIAQQLKLQKQRRAKYGVGSSRVDLQACKLEYSIVSPK